MEAGDFKTAFFDEEDDEWVEQLLEDDELSEWEAGFMKGYREAEREGFE